MVRAASNNVAQMAIFPLQDLMGQGSEQRMNIPGTMGAYNWSWRFTWEQLGTEVGRVLGLVTAASGRAPGARVSEPLAQMDSVASN